SLVDFQSGAGRMPTFLRSPQPSEAHTLRSPQSSENDLRKWIDCHNFGGGRMVLLPRQECRGARDKEVRMPDSSAVGAACPVWHGRHSIIMIAFWQHGRIRPSGARWGSSRRASLDDRRENAAE